MAPGLFACRYGMKDIHGETIQTFTVVSFFVG